MDNGEGHDLVYFGYSDYAHHYSSGVCGQLGCMLMYDLMEFRRLLLVLRSEVALIILQSSYQMDKEEIEFNGRWADDGGRNVE